VLPFSPWQSVSPPFKFFFLFSPLVMRKTNALALPVPKNVHGPPYNGEVSSYLPPVVFPFLAMRFYATSPYRNFPPETLEFFLVGRPRAMKNLHIIPPPLHLPSSPFPPTQFFSVSPALLNSAESFGMGLPFPLRGEDLTPQDIRVVL